MNAWAWRGGPQRGFALFELAISVSIVALVTTLLAQRIEAYREQAERVAMEQVVAALRTSLHAKLIALYVRNRSDEMAPITQQNPMEWLERKPQNYLGEFDSPAEKDVAVGNWYFDKEQKNLVYLLNNSNFFHHGARKQLKFKVQLSRLPLFPSSAPGIPDILDGVVLVQQNE